MPVISTGKSAVERKETQGKPPAPEEDRDTRQSGDVSGDLISLSPLASISSHAIEIHHEPPAPKPTVALGVAAEIEMKRLKERIQFLEQNRGLYIDKETMDDWDVRIAMAEQDRFVAEELSENYRRKNEEYITRIAELEEALAKLQVSEGELRMELAAAEEERASIRPLPQVMKSTKATQTTRAQSPVTTPRRKRGRGVGIQCNLEAKQRRETQTPPREESPPRPTRRSVATQASVPRPAPRPERADIDMEVLMAELDELRELMDYPELETGGGERSTTDKDDAWQSVRAGGALGAIASIKQRLRQLTDEVGTHRRSFRDYAGTERQGAVGVGWRQMTVPMPSTAHHIRDGGMARKLHSEIERRRAEEDAFGNSNAGLPGHMRGVNVKKRGLTPLRSKRSGSHGPHGSKGPMYVARTGAPVGSRQTLSVTNMLGGAPPSRPQGFGQNRFGGARRNVIPGNIYMSQAPS